MGRKNKRKSIQSIKNEERYRRAKRYRKEKRYRREGRYGKGSKTWRDFYLPQATVPAADHAPIIRSSRIYNVHRGDIFFADLGYHRGTSVQEGCRPVLVISNDRGNYHSDTINVIPMTGGFKRPDLPCHMLLKPKQIANRRRPFSPATVLTEQITTVSKLMLRGYVGRIDKEDMAAVEDVLFRHLSDAIRSEDGVDNTSPGGVMENISPGGANENYNNANESEVNHD